MNIKIIKAKKGDARAISGFEDDFILQQRRLLPLYLRQFVKMRSGGQMRKLVSGRKNVFFIAKDDGKSVGYVQCSLDTGVRNKVKTFPLQGWVRSLYVAKKYRKLGIGRKLFACAVDYFKMKRCHYLSLNVVSTNCAKDIYKKWGFEEFTLTMKRKIK